MTQVIAEQDSRSVTVEVVRYDLLNPKALRAALIEKVGPDYQMPGIRQVRRWVTPGDTPMPGWARRATDEILGIPKAAPPGGTLTRRMLIGVMALERRAGIIPAELDAAAEAVEVDALLADELERAQRIRDGRATGRGTGQGGASPSNTRRTR